MGNSMDSYQTYYVYKHVDPTTLEVVYVGIGTKCRAFRSTTGHREASHADWMNDYYHKGYSVVQFTAHGLSKKAAFVLEQELIAELKPKFNKLGNPDHRFSKITDGQVLEMKDLRNTGLSYEKIAEEVGMSTMTVHRALNGGISGIR